MGSLGNIKNMPLRSRISTVVPATPWSDQNSAYELQNMDLLLKLHYIRSAYFFSNDAVQGFSNYDLKKAMFHLLDTYSHVSGRIRRSDSGRPFIKCNDAGVRVAESYCDKTLAEWIADAGYSIDGLVQDHVLGPDLGFSPLVFIQFTRFQCGGLTVGLSWPHVLGDAFSALNFIALWSKIMAGHVPPKALQVSTHTKPELPPSVSDKPISAKRSVDVGERWLVADHRNVKNHSFRLTSKQLNHLGATITTTAPASYFEILSAIVWKSLCQIREDASGINTVTICTNGSMRKEGDFPINGLVFSKVEADFAVEKSDVSELAKLIGEKKAVENNILEKTVEEDEGKGDFVVYGASLTFVDLEGAEFYEVKLNGRKPILANCAFQGVGDEGVVLVLPAPEGDDNVEDGGGNGRIITVALPPSELEQLKTKMETDWGIV
ncbi:protein ECERIFERUM 2 [Prosopis cineraria]|uniref:protein ECERIFERUM 2 n=1 Tax=Prosopis cineraria TaxID=364024 RepID=UPI0024102FD1|nr:protein ECERIFERUM 2 [Prosopis cineraria]